METHTKSRSPSPLSDVSSERTQIVSNTDLKSQIKEVETKSEAKKHETPELVSNFSVASLLADTKISSPKPSFWKASDWFLTDPSSYVRDSPTLKVNDEDHVALSETDIFLVERARSHLPQRPPHPRIPSAIWTMAGQRPLIQGTQWPLSLQTNNNQGKRAQFIFLLSPSQLIINQ